MLTGIILHGMASDRMHNPVKHLTIFFLIMIFIALINRLHAKYPNRFWQIVRDWYAILFFLYFFEATSALNRIIFPDFLDAFFQKIDYFIFGYQPARVWGLMFNKWIISEILHLSYFSYYLMGIFYLAVYLRNQVKFRLYAFILTFVFFLCYLTFDILPVVGGRNLPGMMELTQTYRYGPFTRIMAFIYNSSPHLGGAFPSSHVAIAVVVNISAFDFNRKLGWIILPVVTLLTISTVFCHYHYFIDTMFGLLYGIGFYFTGREIYLKHSFWENHV